MNEVRDRLADLDRLARKHRVPGAAVAVATGGTTAVAASGVVNTRTGVPVTAESVFQIQSITKVWTATLVMQLVDDGLVALGDRVRDHLPAFRTADAEASARITVEHLLTHTGGFEGDLWTPTTAGDDALQRLVEDEVPRLPQQEAPGARYSYCSAGMAVLGRLIEVQRGRPYAAVLRERLAEPLGITEIAFDANDALAFSTAIGHVPKGDRWVPLPVWATMPESNPAAGNRLAMSVRALLAFGATHAADGLAPDSTRVLSEDSARAMREARVPILAAPSAPKAVGLGWEVLGGGPVVGHAGGAIGFGAMLHVVPEAGFAVALVTNGGDAASLVRELVEPLVEEVSGATLTGPAPEPVSPAGLDHYTGVYANGTQRIEVTVDNDGLKAVIDSTGDAAAMLARAGLPPDTAEIPLRKVGPDLFATGTGRYAQFLDTADAPARFVHLGGRSIPRA
ncbi:CubicO group peptidase, beta-lactamase class C family [Glycomyces sambucus]|uniref:CubicO group peptidase, beta-lactamase class C family n=1 Tax=Glycomyces sambucus TaxID=380244 RepID=A0A1G9I445_9ACTN|nr:serine hydrolase [Glycomyces sambucus]SDL19815.1 CubicO group peptidase, beta-lactamase class C family [Glycomyces sambucus]